MARGPPFAASVAVVARSLWAHVLLAVGQSRICLRIQAQHREKDCLPYPSSQLDLPTSRPAMLCPRPFGLQTPSHLPAYAQCSHQLLPL